MTEKELFEMYFDNAESARMRFAQTDNVGSQQASLDQMIAVARIYEAKAKEWRAFAELKYAEHIEIQRNPKGDPT